MIDDTKKKLKSLPAEVLYILTCQKAAELGVMISDRYELDGDQIVLMVELVEKIYVKDLHLADLYSQIRSSFGLTDEQARLLTCDIAGFRLLPVSDWLGEDVANFIRSLGGDALGYAFENEELKTKAAGEMASDAVMNAEPVELPPLTPDDGEFVVFPDDPEYIKATTGEDQPDEDDDADDEDTAAAGGFGVSKEEIIAEYKKILSEDLMELLVTEDHLFIEQFNFRLISLMVENEDLASDLVGVLLKNQSKIGSETLVLDGRQVEPTVENWLKYFNVQKGSQMFDVVVLSDFLVNSANTKYLLARDKELLSRLLQLYRNLKYFPDSLNGDDPEKWQILTLVGDPDYVFHEIEAAGVEETPVTEPKIDLERTSVETAKPPVDYIKLEALRRLGEKYPADSLERMAIDEEIKRLTDA